VEFVDGDDGYDKDTRRLTLRISEHNQEDILDAMRLGFNHHVPPAKWPGWFTSLIHELTHEYQYRVLNDEVTLGGRLLADRPPKRFDGRGHGAGFYSAIADRAAFMGLTAEELCLFL
jgi:hypothetical protein